MFEFRKINKIQAWIFLLIWPWVNIFIVSATLYSLESLTPHLFLLATAKIWGTFILCHLLFIFIENLPNSPLRLLKEKHTYLLRPIVVIFLFISIAPIVEPPLTFKVPDIKILPLAIMLLESTVYIFAIYIFQQQSFFYRSQLHAQQAELQILKMQSNPHFLFNTLNLIASEVIQHPSKAKELIYSLSDLLRDTINLTKTQWITIEEELRLIELYLLLQQKRFEDRFTFDIDCPQNLNGMNIPSLLLMPAVENAIKYGIAPYAKSGHVSVNVELNNSYIEVEVQDTGACFDDKNITYGEGLRILTQTLRVNFSDNHALKLNSSGEGASLKIRFPQVNSSITPQVENAENEY
ncbi:histidine kinase [Microbulbifer sp. VAAF005]|uniref:sensor histidine kinase n=2 Tax=Microbulbifer TaxID=48073 RepID=UPI0024ACFCBD|nr:histidine kinase [Microbulbifer sp. VAAF005]WHI47555.1 histidine kinase [Microbulbifer sp. VAAF005]